jgi:hypothetical protein
MSGRRSRRFAGRTTGTEGNAGGSTLRGDGGRLKAGGLPVAPESSTAFLQQNVVVPKTLQSISVTPANPTIVSGATQQFDAVGLYSDGTTADVSSAATWSSSFAVVAAANGPGSILAVGPDKQQSPPPWVKWQAMQRSPVTPPAAVSSNGACSLLLNGEHRVRKRERRIDTVDRADQCRRVIPNLEFFLRHPGVGKLLRLAGLLAQPPPSSRP